ncbi:unnamed protein product [Orchesella dallaii]|uniref:CUB domain-containing protein n=1 Tax=Orchesella dallaii TaxID=48710 RepID=A0ABP1S0D6_9HEXA
MSFKIFYILLYFRSSCVFSSTISINEDARKNAIVGSRNERSFIGDISQHDEDVSNLEVQRKQTFLLGNPSSDINWQLNQPSDDYEEKNFLDIIAQEVAGLYHMGSCGGSLESLKSGIITYKEYTNYTDNENCTWSIEMPEATGILFTLEKSGFERCCDFLTIYPMGDNKAVNSSPRELGDTNSSVIVSGSEAIVRFTSDSSAIGYGFRLSFQKIPDLGSSVEDVECGGVLTGDAGILNYKLGMDYSNNEWCVWLLHSKASMSFTFYIIQEGFESCCDYLLVNAIDPESGRLQNDTKKLNAQTPFHIIEASSVIITFYSDDSKPGTGFSLQFSSLGSDVNPKYNYKLHHTTNNNGTVKYPDAQMNWEGGNVDERDTIYVIASNAVTNESAGQYGTALNWRSGIFQRMHGSCLYDSLIIYESVFSNERKGSNTHRNWLEKAQFPIRNETFCPEFITTRESNNLLILPEPSFIIIFKVLSARGNGSGTSFKFDYHKKTFVCGGLLEPLESEFGEISYKEDSRYANNENCTWTIEIPGAEIIGFNLEKSGFETCCDGLTVMTSRSNSFDVDLTQSAILKYENSNASFLGSRAMVTFSSDDTSVGTGFRLRYQKLTISNKSDGACGGIVKPLEGEVGLITYNENENYEDNEYCIWLIEVPMAQNISFNLEKNGFEGDFDYLVVISTDALGFSRGLSFKLTSATPTASVAGPRAVVRFSSGDFEIGSGFRLLFGSSEHTLLTQEGLTH